MNKNEIKRKFKFVESKGALEAKHATQKQYKPPAKASHFEIIPHEAHTPNYELSTQLEDT